MSRKWVWLQLVLAWIPVWAMFTTMIVALHAGSVLSATLVALRMMLAAAALGILVQRLTERVPWPPRFHVGFLAIHVAGAVAYALSWAVLNSLVESLVHGRAVMAVGPGLTPFLVFGVWVYVMVAGVSYAALGTERAGRAEAAAARSQLAALRSQINPHFLFNALHTVIQLIPREPAQAALAAERLGALLRQTIEEDRDLVSLAEERAFVERYLELERLRFGDRLQLTMDVSEDADNALVPAFALLTLVENAVRHGVEPNVEPTLVSVHASATADHVLVTVRDDGHGGVTNGSHDGTGLKRLSERLAALYGAGARLDVGPN